MKTDRNHFRKVYKSDHLGVADLEELLEDGKALIFTIKNVKQEYGVTVAGKKGDFNIAYFIENIKPLVLNATNAKQIKLFTGSSIVEDWNNVKVELFCDDSVRMKGEVVGGVRIRKIQPRDKVLREFTEANFDAAKKVNATIELIKRSYSITPVMEKKYLAHGITATATT